MNKTDLINLIAEKTGLSKSQSQSFLDATLDIITDKLSDGESLTLFGFGTFKINHRNARKGRNPRTGEEITIEACNIPTFTPGKALKEAVKK